MTKEDTTKPGNPMESKTVKREIKKILRKDHIEVQKELQKKYKEELKKPPSKSLNEFLEEPTFYLTEKYNDLPVEYRGLQSMERKELFRHYNQFVRTKEPKESPENINKLATLFKEVGREDYFKCTLEKSIEINISNIETYELLGEYYFQKNNFYQTIKLLEKIVSERKATSKIINFYKKASSQKKQWLQIGAEIIRRNILSLTTEKYNTTASNIMHFKKEQMFIDILEVAIKNKKANEKTYLMLSDYYATNKNLEKSLQVIYQAISDKKASGMIQFKLNERSNLKKYIFDHFNAMKESDGSPHELIWNKIDEICARLYSTGYFEKYEDLVKLGIKNNKATKRMINYNIKYLNTRKRQEEIVQLLESVVDKEIMDSNLYSNLIAFNELLGNEEKAKEFTELAIEQKKVDENLFRSLAADFESEKINKPERSIEILERAIEAGFNTPLILEDLIGKYYHSNQIDKTIELGKKAIKEKKETENTILTLSAAHINNNQLIKAWWLITPYVKDKECCPELICNYARIFMNLNQTNKAIHILEKAKSLDRVNKECLMNLHTNYRKKGNIKKAIETIEYGRKNLIIDDDLLLFLANDYIAINNYRKSEEILEQLLHLTPKSHLSRIIFADVCNKIYERYNNITNRLFKKINVINKITTNKKKFQKKSIEILNQIIEENSADVFAYELLSEIYIKNSEENKSELLLKNAVENKKTSAKIYRTLAGLENINLLYKKFPEFRLDQMLENLFNTEKFKLSEEESKQGLYYLEKAIDHDDAISEDFLNLIVQYMYYNRNQDVNRVIKKAANEGKANALILGLLAEETGEIKWYRKLNELIENESSSNYQAYYMMSELIRDVPKHIKQKLNFKTSSEYLKLMVQQMRKNKEFKSGLGNYKQATNKLKKISNTDFFMKDINRIALFDSIIVKEKEINKQNKSSFKEEKRIHAKLEKILEKEVDMPKSIDEFIDGNKAYYVMTLEEGITLTNLILTNCMYPQIYHEILGIIAKIHVKFPLEALADYSLEDKLSKKISNKEIEPDFKNYCKPVIEVLNKSKNMCYNKDSTTENWMVNPVKKDKLTGKNIYQIVLIDTEDKGIVPYALDLASFLNLDEPFVDFEERFDYVQLYIDTVNNI
ncbi:hypothetical protein HOK51_02315, partial [Candidatus Woesearchaeota archaeon]|nr:hypothetical protein [Candidatus Woesearchaeota archaeon]MBT7368841.1 hypothetical protein [Candidatus Woesearchaeota archaeon]